MKKSNGSNGLLIRIDERTKNMEISIRKLSGKYNGVHKTVYGNGTEPGILNEIRNSKYRFKLSACLSAGMIVLYAAVEYIKYLIA